MALTHLADTSVLTRLRAPAVRSVVRPLLSARSIARCTMTDLELGFSAQNAADWDTIAEAAALCEPVEVLPADFARALSVQRALAERGLKGRRVPDLLIAAVAERARLSVLHYDNGFELIAQVTGQRHAWVVPRGSID